MVDFRDHHVFRALQFRAVIANAGRPAGLAEEPAVWLCVLVVVVAAQGHEAHAGDHFVGSGVELGQERPLALNSLPRVSSQSDTPWLTAPLRMACDI